MAEIMRIQKLLSNYGICSRRKCESLILEKKIKVNNKIIDELGFKCSIDDLIEVDGNIIKFEKEKEKIYLLLNKPKNYLCTLYDPQNRKKITDLIPPSFGRLYPIGRLDYNTKGLIILTNDGNIANLLIHPSTALEKEYIAKCKNSLYGDELLKLKRGVFIEELNHTPKIIDANIINSDKNTSTFSLVLKEGKKREIRLLLKAINHEVIELERIRIGNITKGNLKEGEYRLLNLDEINYIKNGKI